MSEQGGEPRRPCFHSLLVAVPLVSAGSRHWKKLISVSPSVLVPIPGLLRDEAVLSKRSPDEKLLGGNHVWFL